MEYHSSIQMLAKEVHFPKTNSNIFVKSLNKNEFNILDYEQKNLP